MLITSSSLQLASTHHQETHQSVSESFQFWVGNRRPDSGNRNEASDGGSAPSGVVTLSEAGQAAQAGETPEIGGTPNIAEGDPVLTLIRLLLSKLTGREIKVFDGRELQRDTTPPAQAANPAASPATRRAGWGLEYDYHSAFAETEQTSFAASGTVKTADGREISFSVTLEMARSYATQTDISLRLGEAQQTRDPLVINFSGTAAQLTGRRFAFDLDADGNASEQINFATGGSGFLVFDRSGNGMIDDGSELFGATTGDGFAELAALDGDTNGWIDENDPAYARLAVWAKDESGNDLMRSLHDAGVGAISLTRIATPFDIKDADNLLKARVRASGLYLTESGAAGTLQQVDLTA